MYTYLADNMLCNLTAKHFTQPYFLRYNTHRQL